MFQNINAYILKCVNLSAGEVDYFNSMLQYKVIPQKNNAALLEMPTFAILKLM